MLHINKRSETVIRWNLVISHVSQPDALLELRSIPIVLSGKTRPLSSIQKLFSPPWKGALPSAFNYTATLITPTLRKVDARSPASMPGRFSIFQLRPDAGIISSNRSRQMPAIKLFRLEALDLRHSMECSCRRRTMILKRADLDPSHSTTRAVSSVF